MLPHATNHFTDLQGQTFCMPYMPLFLSRGKSSLGLDKGVAKKPHPYISVNVITLNSHFNDGLAKPTLILGHGWLIKPRNYKCNYLYRSKTQIVSVIWNGPQAESHWASTNNIMHGHLTRYVKLRVAHGPGIPGTCSPRPRVSEPDMHHGTCTSYVPWCMSGSLTSGFLSSQWRGKRFRHSRGGGNPQFCVSGKKPMATRKSRNCDMTSCQCTLALHRATMSFGGANIKVTRDKCPVVMPRTGLSPYILTLITAGLWGCIAKSTKPAFYDYTYHTCGKVMQTYQ